MSATNAGAQPQDLPQGWRAVWNESHQEWFYVNLQTSASQWNKPSSPALPSSNSNNPFANDASSTVKTPSDARTGDILNHGNNNLPTYSAGTAEGRRQDDLVYEKEVLADYDFEDSAGQNSSTESSNISSAWSKRHSCRVLVKRYSKLDPQKLAAAQRELNALHLIGGTDNAVPPLLDYFDPANTVFIVCEDRQDESLRKYIESRGPLTGDLLKAVVTQLMSALCNIFMNGFAHLKMCDETLFIDKNGQLTIKDFQYAVSYDTEKVESLYAAVGHEVKGTTGIWRAPEVYAAEEEGVKYNGRKAVIWSCGVIVYYMATGQLEKLSNLNHPAFKSRRPTISSTPSTQAATATPADPSIETATESPKSRRLSLGHRRRSSAKDPAALHNRKQSLSSFTPPTLISYPGNRLEISPYARDIISKMLIVNPLARAELIEVAAKVPKEFVVKQTRPLMELAWLDYKNHVGPYAGMGIGANEWSEGGAGDDSSIYSGISSLSQSFTGLLSGRRQSKSKADYR